MTTRTHRRQSHFNSNSPLPRIALLAVALLALVLLASGTRMFLGGIASYQAEAFISSWEKNGKEPDARGWQIAQGAAQRAVSLYPVASGDYLDRLGRVYSWQQFQHAYGDPAAAGSRQAAATAYRASITARPTWPYTWERLAHTKLFLQEFDAEFDQALAQAFQLGPWRIAVNREVADIGLSAWPHLNEPQREATRESVRRSVAYSSNESVHMVIVALNTGKVPELCNSLTPELKVARKLCL